MISKWWLILLILPFGEGLPSPYYYREDKHHSEHHKEYSYGNGQSSSLNTYESYPQKYYESSHYSSHATPERYYKLESSPSYSSGFSQYSGGQSSYHHSGFQSGQSIPLATGQNLNLEGLKPGTYVFKQVKVYGQPQYYSTQTGSYSASSQNGKLETKELGKSFFDGQHEDSLDGKNMFGGQQEEKLNVYYQSPQTSEKENLYGQRSINVEDLNTAFQVGQQTEELSGQKEESNCDQSIETFGDHHDKGDLEIGQVEENINTQNSQSILNPKQGYKYYEKRIITYGQPTQDSNIYKKMNAQYDQRQESLHTGDLIEKSTTKTPTLNENVYTSRKKTEHISYNQEVMGLGEQLRPSTSPAYYTNPGYPQFIPEPKEVKGSPQERGIQNSYGQQRELPSAIRPIESGKEESSYGQISEDLGQQQVQSSFEIGQHEDEGQQLEVESLELGGEKKGNENKIHSWQRQVNTSKSETREHKTEIIGKKPESVREQLDTGSLVIGNSYSKPFMPIKPNLPKSASISQPKYENVLGSRGDGIRKIEEMEDFGQREESPEKMILGEFAKGQQEEPLEIGQQSENYGQFMEKDLMIGQKEESISSQMPEKDILEIGQKEDLEIGQKEDLEIGQKEESPIDLQPSTSVKLTTIKPNKNQIKSYSYNRHESHYNEHKVIEGSQEQMPVPIQQPGFPTIYNQGATENNQRTNYLELQRKAEELALQLGSDESTKEKSSQQERDFYEEKYKSKARETTKSEVYTGKAKEIGLNINEEPGSYPHHIITHEIQKEEYGTPYSQPTQTLYSSKKMSKHVKSGYKAQPMTQNYGYPGESQQYQHFGGYQQGQMLSSGEKSYISDQPVQRTHTSGSQYSFSSFSGSSQDKHKAIDDFLSELDKDIARSNHQQRQQQGSYSEVIPGRSGGSGSSYYSEKTVSSHSNTSYSSSGTTSGGNTGTSWYQRIGDSIGSSYNQAKDKAKEVLKSVKQSVGYSS